MQSLLYETDESGGGSFEADMAERVYKIYKVGKTENADKVGKAEKVIKTDNADKVGKADKVSKPEPVISKLRKAIRELGPLGMLALIAAVFIFKSLLADDLNSGLLSSSASSEQTVLEERQREKVTALFESIEEVTVDNIIISYETITDSSTTLFASNQNSQLVAKSVVVLHQGTIVAEYDITRAISLLLDVPFHQISLLNTTDIIGGN